MFVGILITMFHMLWVLRAGPYIREADDTMQFAASLAILMTLLAGLYLQVEADTLSTSDTSIIDVILLIVASFVIVSWLTAIVLAIRPLRKKLCCGKCEGSNDSVHYDHEHDQRALYGDTKIVPKQDARAASEDGDSDSLYEGLGFVDSLWEEEEEGAAIRSWGSDGPGNKSGAKKQRPLFR